LSTKEGKKDIYRMAKRRERKMRDIIQVKCIKNATKRLITKDEDIKNRWWEYFDKLFNEDSGARPLSETSLQMTLTNNSCVGFKNLGSKMS
jgi:hypothetical protein